MRDFIPAHGVRQGDFWSEGRGNDLLIEESEGTVNLGKPNPALKSTFKADVRGKGSMTLFRL